MDQKGAEIVVDVEVGPGDVDAGEDLDVGELGFGGVLKALQLFAGKYKAAAVVQVKDDEVQSGDVFAGEGEGFRRELARAFESGIDVCIGCNVHDFGLIQPSGFTPKEIPVTSKSANLKAVLTNVGSRQIASHFEVTTVVVPDSDSVNARPA